MTTLGTVLFALWGVLTIACSIMALYLWLKGRSDAAVKAQREREAAFLASQSNPRLAAAKILGIKKPRLQGVGADFGLVARDEHEDGLLP